MRLTSVELIDRKMEKEIEKFLDFTGRDYWKDVIIKADTTDGNFYKELYLLRRNPFIQPLKLYFQLRSEGRCIWKHKTNEMNDLARHAYVINRVVNNLGDNAKKYIRGKLRDEKGIKPFLFELHIATHFLRRGLEVVFSEYEARDISGKTFEFLVSGDGIEREIECKWKGVDAGRKITRPGFYILCDEIFKRVVPKIGGKRCIVELICNKSLGKNKNKLIEISENILQGINGGKVELVLGGGFQCKNTLSGK